MKVLSVNIINKIASKINEKINIPILNEDMELLIIQGLIMQIERIIIDKFDVNLADFVTDTEAALIIDLDELKATVIAVLNPMVNIPVIGEKTEEKLFDALLSTVIDLVQKGNSIEV